MNDFSDQQLPLEEPENEPEKRNSPGQASSGASIDRMNFSMDETQIHASSPHNHEEEHPERANFSFLSTELKQEPLSFVSPSNLLFSEIKTKKSFPVPSQQVRKESIAWTILLKVSVIIFSLVVAGYLCLEIIALTEIYEHKTIKNEKNPIIAWLMKSFSGSEMLLFMNVHLSIFVYVFGLVVVIYSAIVLFIKREKTFPGLEITHRRLAKIGHICFFSGFLFGGLVQSFLFLTNGTRKTIKQVIVIYAFLIVKGGIFYLYMSCFKYAVSQKKPERIALEGQEMKNMRANAEGEFNENWVEFYEDMEAPDENEDQDVYNFDHVEEHHQRDASLRIDLGDQSIHPRNSSHIQELEINVRGI